MSLQSAFDWIHRRWHRRGELRRAHAWRCKNVGPRTLIDPTAQVLGWRQVRIGHHTIISEDVWINSNQLESAETVVSIGDNAFIGRRNFLNAGARLVLGDYCLTGPDCHFLGADHKIDSPFVPYVSSGATLDGIIEVGPNCWFGSSVIVLKNVRIGYGCVIGAGAVVTQDVPSFSLVVGSPARVVKRFDVRAGTWVKAAEFSAESESLLPSEEQYLAGLREKFPSIKGPRQAMSGALGDL